VRTTSAPRATAAGGSTARAIGSDGTTEGEGVREGEGSGSLVAEGAGLGRGVLVSDPPSNSEPIAPRMISPTIRVPQPPLVVRCDARMMFMNQSYESEIAMAQQASASALTSQPR